MASEGWIEERGEELLAFGRPFPGAVYDHGERWRGHRHRLRGGSPTER